MSSESCRASRGTPLSLALSFSLSLSLFLSLSLSLCLSLSLYFAEIVFLPWYRYANSAVMAGDKILSVAGRRRLWRAPHLPRIYTSAACETSP